MKKKVKIIILAVLAVCVLGIAGYFVYDSYYKVELPEEPSGEYDCLTGLYCKELPARPLVVSTDNVQGAWPQSGLSSADIIYQVPAEGSQTRLEVIYYSKMPEEVGPVRSVRPYIVDIAREYQAILVHHGWSPEAHEIILSGVVDAINPSVIGDFYRVSSHAAPHNSYVKLDDIWKAAEDMDFNKEKDLTGFTFFDEDYDLAAAIKADSEMTDEEKAEAAETEAKEKARLEAKAEKEGVELPEEVERPGFARYKSADGVVVNYNACSNEFRYDSEKGVYLKWIEGNEHVDELTGEQVGVKNVIIQRVEITDVGVKGRLTIDMTAGGEAMLLTQGKVIKGTWSRKDQDSRTVFRDKDGVEFSLTPGNTWVMVVDQSVNVELK